eukprot:7531055-Heterocapsa_arctica.AAC.1
MAGFTRQSRPVLPKEEEFDYATAADHYWKQENCGKRLPVQLWLSNNVSDIPHPAIQPAMAANDSADAVAAVT